MRLFRGVLVIGLLIAALRWLVGFAPKERK